MFISIDFECWWNFELPACMVAFCDQFDCVGFCFLFLHVCVRRMIFVVFSAIVCVSRRCKIGDDFWGLSK